MRPPRFRDVPRLVRSAPRSSNARGIPRLLAHLLILVWAEPRGSRGRRSVNAIVNDTRPAGTSTP